MGGFEHGFNSILITDDLHWKAVYPAKTENVSLKTLPDTNEYRVYTQDQLSGSISDWETMKFEVYYFIESI